jgi:hypothetical protein
MSWSAWAHYVFAGGEWHRCPRDCGGMCEWRPGEVVDLESRRSKG